MKIHLIFASAIIFLITLFSIRFFFIFFINYYSIATYCVNGIADCNLGNNLVHIDGTHLSKSDQKYTHQMNDF